MSSVYVFDNLKKTAYGTATGLVLALSAGEIVRVTYGSFAEKGREVLHAHPIVSLPEVWRQARPRGGQALRSS